MDFKVDFKMDLKVDTGHQIGLQGGYQGVVQEVLHGVEVFRWTKEEVIWVRNVQGWFQWKFKGTRVAVW